MKQSYRKLNDVFSYVTVFLNVQISLERFLSTITFQTYLRCIRTEKRISLLKLQNKTLKEEFKTATAVRQLFGALKLKPSIFFQKIGGP